MLIFYKTPNPQRDVFTRNQNETTKGLIIFPNSNEHRQKLRSTTANPITTTINSYWSSWSATQPNTLNEVQNEHNHSASLIDSVPVAQNQNNVDGLLPWMKDILNDNSTTERPVRTTTERIPSWLQNVLGQHTTSSTTKSPVITSTATELPNWLKDVLDRQTSSTTTQMPNWLRDVLNRHTTTETTNPFNQFSNDHETTTRSWNNDILFSYSTTTLRPIRSTSSKSTFGDGFMSNGGGGDDNGIEFIDLTDTDRYSK